MVCRIWLRHRWRYSRPLRRVRVLAVNLFCLLMCDYDRTAVAMISAARTGFARISCSHKRITRHPDVESCQSTSASRCLVRLSFLAQKSALLSGTTPCSGQPCQKHPSTKTVSLARRKVRSGRPGSAVLSRYRNPRFHNSFLRRISGPVSRPLFRDIHKLRCCGVRTLVIR